MGHMSGLGELKKLVEPAETKKPASISALAFHKAAKLSTLASATSTGSIHVYNVKAQSLWVVSHVHDAPISCLEWHPAGRDVFSGDTSGNVILTR